MTETVVNPLPHGDSECVTAPFVTGAGDYLRVIMRWWLHRYGWLIMLPVAGLAVAGVATEDVRLAIVALVLIFIILPMVMSMIYIYYMLTPQARRVVLRKRVVIARDRYLRLEYLREPRDESVEEGEAAPESGQDEFPPPVDETIGWEDIGEICHTPKYLIFVLRDTPRQMIMIPHAAIKH